MTDTSPAKVGRSKSRLFFIIIGGMVAAAVAALILIVVVGQIRNQLENQAPAFIAISGNVHTNGIGTHPTMVSFHDTGGSGNIENTVDGTHYLVNAPNGNHNWQVQITWQGLAGSSGICDAGFIQYTTMNSPFLNKDISC